VPDICMPYAPNVEKEVLPNPEKVAAAARDLMAY
jgi:pyruvate/2-oxoglutarate/acetoin dehydrogenase E1 component